MIFHNRSLFCRTKLLTTLSEERGTNLNDKHEICEEEMVADDTRLEVPHASKKAINIYSWMEWVIINGFPSKLVANDLNQKNTKLENMSTNTLKNYLDRVTKKVDENIKTQLPEKIGNMLDGWCKNSTSTHFLAIFAVYQFQGVETP